MNTIQKSFNYKLGLFNDIKKKTFKQLNKIIYQNLNIKNIILKIRKKN